MYNVIKFQAPFERLKGCNYSPEVTLFKAMITQAIIDVTNISQSKESKKIEKEAKDWIFGGGEFFQEICYLAGMEPDYIIKLAKEAIYLKNIGHASKLQSKKGQTKDISLLY